MITQREAYEAVCAELTHLSGSTEAFEALRALEPADPRRQVNRWGEEAAEALYVLRDMRVRTLAVAKDSLLEAEQMRAIMAALRQVRAIDKTIENAIMRAPDVEHHVEYLMYRYELRRETAWLNLADLPSLPPIDAPAEQAP